MNRVGFVALAGTALVSCGGTATTASGPDPAAQAQLMKVDELAAGKLDTLPTGGQFVRIASFHQAPGETTPSRKHQAGLVYQKTGQQELASGGGQSLEIGAGTAAFLVSVAHSHTNNGSTENAWYFIALWPSVQRGLPLVGTSTVAFETEDIPSSALPPGSYVETLRRVTLQAGGHSAAHRFGGLEVVFVLDGALTVNVTGQSPVRLSTGQGAYVAPDTTTQELATGSGTVDYLAYFVTQQGVAFETDVSTAPLS